jgi:hypothetical protein
MPLGSSSEAPVIRPGSRTPSNRGLAGSTTGLGPRSAACSISKAIYRRLLFRSAHYRYPCGRAEEFSAMKMPE